MEIVNVTDQIIEVNVTNNIVNIQVQTGAYPLPNNVYSVFGRVGNVVAQEGDYTLDQLSGVTIAAPASGQVLKYNGSAWVNSSEDNPVTSVFGRTGAVTAQTGDYTTSQVTEGSNLYYTQTRFDNALAAKSTSNLAEGTNLYYTDARVHNAISAIAPISEVSGVVSISQAGTSSNGYLSSTDWNTFNSKQAALTTGNLTSSDISVSGGTGAVIGSGATMTLASVNSNVGSYGTSTSVPTIQVNAKGLVTAASQTAIPTASTSTTGLLTSANWNTFNNKQAALGGTGFVKSTAGVISYDTNTYLTTISGIAAGGELSGTYANPSLVNSAVTGKVLTGLNLTGGGTIADTDTILGAFGKVQNQISALVGGVMYQGTWNASTNTPSITSSVGTKGHYYIVSVAGSTNINGITDWKVGDWIIFNGSTWDKVDNTDAVSSVNGYTGAVSLVTSDVTESGNLYFTNARAIGSTLTGYTSGAGAITSSDSVLTAIQKLNGNVGALVTGVSSVFGRTGAVTAASGDYNTDQVTEGSTNLYYTASRFNTAFAAKSTTDLAEGTNLYYTEGRVSANTDVAANTAARHSAVTLGTANGLSLSTQQLSLGLASASANGALSSTDWSTFNAKQSALTFGNLTESTSSVLTITGGSNAVIGSGTTIQVKQASGSQSGFLSSTDWTTFNSKQNALTNPVTGTGTTNYLPKFTGASTIGDSLIYDDGTGIAIGDTTASGFKFKVNGTTSLTGALSGTSATFSGNVRRTGSGSIYTELQSDGIYANATDLYLLAPSTKSVFIYANNAPALTISSTGAATFSSSVTAGGNIISQGSYVDLQNTSYIRFSNSGGGTRWGYIQHDGTNLAFKNDISGGNFNFTGGNVGIGTSSPAAKMDIVGDLRIRRTADTTQYIDIFPSGGYGYIDAINSASATNQTLVFRRSNNVGYTESMRITDGGNVLIGTTTNASNYQFVVNTTAYVKQFIAFGVNDEGRYLGQGNQISGSFQSYDLSLANYATSGRITITNSTTGVYLPNGSTSWSTFSDERLKNINGMIDNAIEKLSSIRAVDYSWKSDATKKHNLGLIAQDVEKVFPQVIDLSKSFDENDDTEYLSVKYTELIPVLVAAIQELSAKVTALENKS